MLTPAHRKLLINDVMKGIEVIGPGFEAFANTLVDFIVSEQLQHRGLNSQGHPVGHVVDSVSRYGHIVAEYSAEQAYFERPFKKIRKDLRHSRKSHPQVKNLLLFSSQECGPKAHTQLTNFCARVKRWMDLDLDLYDSRRQAEYIVDHLLLKDAAIDALSPYLVTLEKVRAEFAATHVLPAITQGYLERPELEKQLLERLLKDRVAILAGMSGTGKSSVAVVVATFVASQFDLVIWVPASSIEDARELRSIEVERHGHRINLEHLLRDRSCLAILDDLRIGVSTVELQTICGSRSAVLVTRQSAFDGDIRMPLLEREDARSLLEQGAGDSCPDNVFDIIWDAVGGHPLAIRLMSAGVRHSSWDELAIDCKSIGQYADADKLQRLADRLLGRLERLLEKELAFVAWCQSIRLDRNFVRFVLGSIGIRKIDDACLTAADRADVLRVHEIVYSSMQTIALHVDRYEAEFNSRLDSYIEQLAFERGTSLQFLSFCQVHSSRLEDLLTRNPNRSGCLFCLAHAWSDQEIELSLLGDPLSRAQALTTSTVIRDIDVSAICESVEAIYRKRKQLSGISAARSTLDQCLGVFDDLADSPHTSRNGRRTAIHHKAKALRNLQRYDEAIELCESILREHDSPATQLLLARLLIFKDKADIERAKNLLFEILKRAQESASTAEVSVTLAAIETLGRWQLKQWFREALEQFGALVTNLIVESAERGLDQAYSAFASIGRELRYNNQELFVRVFEQMPAFTPEDARDDKERSAWGHILLAASQALLLARSNQLAMEALEFYDSIASPDDFTIQEKGHALVILNRNAEAVELLSPLVSRTPNPWNRYWLSKGLLGIGRQDEALEMVNEALKDPKAKDYLATLFEQRWEIRNSTGDPGAIDDLRSAHDSCRDAKHRDALAKKIAAVNAIQQV
jgi:tetratricopeptide (TPR) repeat protein